MSTHKKFHTYSEAKVAVKKLEIKTRQEYTKRYKEDPKLPSSPTLVYKDSWIGTLDFFSKEKPNYLTYDEAKKAVQVKGFQSVDEYLNGYKSDPKLAGNPRAVYKTNWLGWPDFLGTFYTTLTEAKKAALSIGARHMEEYRKNYKTDPKLPYHPNQLYRDSWVNWGDFLESKSFLYISYSQAQSAVRTLTITTHNEYQEHHKKDPRLPSNPSEYYVDNWINWNSFLDQQSCWYKTYAQAQTAVQIIGFKTMDEYESGYTQDIKLPRYPAKLYAGIWTSPSDFFGIRSEIYQSYTEAQFAVQKLGFHQPDEYKSGYKIDARLPKSPQKYYSTQWTSWKDFLVSSLNYYRSYSEAREACKKLGFKNSKDYQQGHLLDPKLPYVPHLIYQHDWINWGAYLSLTPPFYKTYIEAKNAVKQLNLNTAKEYQEIYKKYQELPRNPKEFYSSDWTTWLDFLDTKLTPSYSFLQAQSITQETGIKSAKEYREQCKADLKLPKDPHKFYTKEWTSWDDFLNPINADSLIKAKSIVQMAGISSAKEYGNRYKELKKNLPRNPNRVFASDWVNWYDFLGTEPNSFYSYTEASELIKASGVTKQNDYSLYRTKSKDKKLYNDPSAHYEEWINWFVFFGTEEPFQPKYIRGKYISWKTSIDLFMKKARGGTSKKTTLSKFVRLYIQKHSIGFSPIEFLCRKVIKTDLFDQFLESSFSLDQKKTAVTEINEFLDYVLLSELTIEDDETGELVRLNDAKNPFLNYYVDQPEITRPSESVKPRLQFIFIDNARKWIIPDSAKYFSDLNHLYDDFDSDWHEIDPILIDKSDPNCITKKITIKKSTKHYIWCPVNWIHTYVLMELPLRGRQIAYNDSGEADYEIPDIDENGNIFWKKNEGPLAGQTKNQSFVKKYPNDHLGYYSTTNKTSNSGDGFSVPWIPTKVAYWLIRLRNWQSKYNALKVVTPWANCTKTNFNTIQLKAKGQNCFLFRAFNKVEALSFQAALADRIAVALYHTQPLEIILATCPTSKLQSISHYKTLYSPHSMRVGLISAFIFEYGLPHEIVMKIVGHSTIVMTLYYAKIGSVTLTKRMEDGEKKALKDAVYSIQEYVEQQKIDELKNQGQLLSNTEELLANLDNDFPGTSFTFSDIGICPFANDRCYEGGEEIKNSRLHSPVPAGYRGKQNCIRCRFFITGPAYMGGLLSNYNEISLQTKKQSQLHAKVANKINMHEETLNKLDIEEYESQIQNLVFTDDPKRLLLERELRKLNTELEVTATKMDMFLCDLQCSYRLLIQCQDLLKKHSNSNENELMLIKQSDIEIIVSLEETSDFHQLSEICENAEIYDSANADLAITQRSQLLDNMVDSNGIKPFLFKLTEQQQLEAGNQVTRLMLARLKSWDKVSALVDGDLQLDDLLNNEKGLKEDIHSLFQDNSFSTIRI